MPKFKVIGADRETGEAITKAISAESADDAEEIAQDRGILVSNVEPIESAPVRRREAPVHPSQPPTVQPGHQRGDPAVNVNLPKRSSSLGIVALVIGIVALLISFIPFLGILSIPLAALALLMAVIGLVISLFRSGAGIGWPIGGGVVAGLALVIGMAQVAIIGGAATAIDEAVDAVAEERQRLAEDWDPPEGFTRDQIEFHVSSTSIERVPLRGMGAEGESENENFVIWIRVHNHHASRRLVVSDLQERFTFGDRTSLEDSAGNRYAHIDFGHYEPTYSHGRLAIDPESSEEVALFFERPTDRADGFTLSIPAQQFEGRGTLKLRF